MYGTQGLKAYNVRFRPEFDLILGLVCCPIQSVVSEGAHYMYVQSIVRPSINCSIGSCVTYRCDVMINPIDARRSNLLHVPTYMVVQASPNFRSAKERLAAFQNKAESSSSSVKKTTQGLFQTLKNLPICKLDVLLWIFIVFFQSCDVILVY